ncbi:hypothetical protein J6590_021033 [Homalodisca vitripennis]|nr:hypothetical protein J6590_021033 [Homalodisca vitripennis]
MTELPAHTDTLALDVFSERLSVKIELQIICRSHRVGRVPQLGVEGGKKPRPVLVKITSYRQRREVYSNKNHSKRNKNNNPGGPHCCQDGDA